jgi:hypothetical protein
MTRSLPVQVVPRVAASAAVVFGVVTVMAGGRVLLGGDPGYLVFRPLLLFNTGMGAVYLIAGALVWRGAPSGRRLAGAIALVNAVVLAGVTAIWFAGGPVAPDSVGAMAFRTLVWAAIWASLIWAGRGLGAGGRLLMLLALGVLLPTSGNGQAGPTGNPESADSEPPRPVPLPPPDLFRPLLADPKQPQFAASYLWASSGRIETRVGAVAFGENFGIVRWHVTGRLAVEPAQRRLLLLLTDGRPNDVDQYEGRYGVEDTRRAVREAACEGILVFGLTVDRTAPAYLTAMFGPGRAALLRRPERLPAALVEVLRRLLEPS